MDLTVAFGFVWTKFLFEGGVMLKIDIKKEEEEEERKKSYYQWEFISKDTKIYSRRGGGKKNLWS